MAVPTFVIAGAQKCGTTTLHLLLGRHPQIFVSRPKEIHFFDRKWDKGLDWYFEHFTPTPTQVHAGESTPTYMYDADSRDRMAKTIPDAQIILILRDPVARAYSHYWHVRRHRMERMPTFEEALEREPRRLAHSSPSFRARYAYLDRGLYLDQIEAFEKAYGRDRLHVMLLEDLTSEPRGALKGVFAFLGVDTGPARRIKPREYNVWRPVELAATKKTAADVGDPSGPMARLAAAQARKEAKAKAAATPRPKMAADTRARLEDFFRPHNERLAAWLGRDLSHWG
jgi:Sulfotransferase domain